MSFFSCPCFIWFHVFVAVFLSALSVGSAAQGPQSIVSPLQTLSIANSLLLFHLSNLLFYLPHDNKHSAFNILNTIVVIVIVIIIVTGFDRCRLALEAMRTTVTIGLLVSIFQIQAAYEILRDSESKLKLDQRPEFRF